MKEDFKPFFEFPEDFKILRTEEENRKRIDLINGSNIPDCLKFQDNEIDIEDVEFIDYPETIFPEAGSISVDELTLFDIDPLRPMTKEEYDNFEDIMRRSL